MRRSAAVAAVSSLLSACSVPALYPPWARDETCIDHAVRSLRAVVVRTETVEPTGLVYLIAFPSLPSSTLPELGTDRADIALFEDLGPNQELIFTIYVLGEPWSERSRPLFPVERRRLRRLMEQDCDGEWVSPHAVQATLPRFVAEPKP